MNRGGMGRTTTLRFLHHTSLRWRGSGTEGRSSGSDDELDGFLNDIGGVMAVVWIEDILKAEETSCVPGGLGFCGWAVRGPGVCKR